MGKIVIYGAKSIALGCCRAIREQYPDCLIDCFLVKSIENNPEMLDGLCVKELADYNNKDVNIVIATPEDIHSEIVNYLEENGFYNYVCLDSRKESKLMGMYYEKQGVFKSLRKLRTGTEKADLLVYSAKFYRDKPLKNKTELPKWIQPIQVGAVLSDMRICDCVDDEGENISVKNVNYCELTALYWVWKNKLQSAEIGKKDYYGLFHYRRILDVNKEDILRLKNNDIDVILPFPTIHEPDIKEHHARYVKESDWEAMLRALEELSPEYYGVYEDIFSQEYLYNYNMLIAKNDVLKDYCEWLFPILERTEELSVPKGNERKDRYIGYLGENLLTLYFMYNKNKLNIVHTGRIMLT